MSERGFAELDLLAELYMAEDPPIGTDPVYGIAGGIDC